MEVLPEQKQSKARVVYTRLEENFNIFTHLLGFVLALLGSIFLIVRTAKLHGALEIFAIIVYGLALLCCFGMSTLYHFMPADSGRRTVFRHLDHCSISLLIAGTYTPFMLIGVGGVLGIVLASINLGLACMLIVFNAIDVHKFRVLSIIMYLVMGWLILPVIGTIVSKLGLIAFLWMIGGGVCFTVGVIFYKLKSMPFNHAVWHVLVLMGAVCLYVSMFVYVI
ncbi:MAG: hemolysin III family protein [Firmicutes bacterium]|nr:hemolysin III family protein [Bacillota bacterium]MCL1953319.1 hemolysin III family protein [Bacillota bacterium]